MKRFTTYLFVVVLSSIIVAFPSKAQTDPMLITVDSDGVFMTQSSPDDAPEILGLIGDGSYSREFLVDQRYIAQTITAPEYSALSDDEKAVMTMIPNNIVVMNLQTGDEQLVAGQIRNTPDDPWFYRSTPVWSPTGNQIAFTEASDIHGASLKIYDVDSQTVTTLADMLPMGYSDAGMIGWPTVHWSEVGLYSLVSNIAPDRLGFAQTLTVVDPTGQQPVLSKVVGRTLSGGELMRDTVLATVPSLDQDGKPVLLMVTAAGEWFIPVMEGYGKGWRTLVLRPSGGGDIEVRFAQFTKLDPDLRQYFPNYRAFIRRGDGVFEPLDMGFSISAFNLGRLAQGGGLYVAPDGSSIIYREIGGNYVQWFGPGDTRDVDFDGRTVVSWGDWVVHADRNSSVRPYLTVIDGPPTVRVIREEPVEIHSGPSEDADVIGELQPGETVRVVTGPLYIGFSNWYEIVVSDELSGWVESEQGEDHWFED